MDQIVAAEGPAWLWIGAVLFLMFISLVIGWATCKVLKVSAALAEYEGKTAAKADVEREIAALNARVAKLETPTAIPVYAPRPDAAPRTRIHASDPLDQTMSSAV